MIPEIYVVISFLAAGAGCLYYARTRRVCALFGWLALPSFTIAGLYIWFLLDDLPLAQRISEATLTFRREAWLTRKFPHVSIAEGENWIQGREDHVIEIPPQQIIVAFTHGANQSSRSVPPNEKPSCFWGFPKEYLMFIHGLVGVQVE